MKRRNLVKIAVSALLAIIMIAFIGCSTPAKAKTFEKAGMSIELTNEFTEKEMVQFTACYMSSTVIVTVLKEEFSLAQGFENYTLMQYAGLVIRNNQIDVTAQMSEDDKYAYFRYDKTVTGKDFTYWATCFKSDDAFWLIQFACETKNYEEMAATFEKYADSVTFVVDDAQ